jgi:hypothetical protein
MPALTQNKFEVVPLHPTFAAEVKGVNFKNISDEDFAEIHDAISQVSDRFQEHRTEVDRFFF